MAVWNNAAQPHVSLCKFMACNVGQCPPFQFLCDFMLWNASCKRYLSVTRPCQIISSQTACRRLDTSHLYTTTTPTLPVVTGLMRQWVVQTAGDSWEDSHWGCGRSNQSLTCGASLRSTNQGGPRPGVGLSSAQRYHPRHAWLVQWPAHCSPQVTGRHTEACQSRPIDHQTRRCRLSLPPRMHHTCLWTLSPS